MHLCIYSMFYCRKRITLSIPVIMELPLLEVCEDANSKRLLIFEGQRTSHVIRLRNTGNQAITHLTLKIKTMLESIKAEETGPRSGEDIYEEDVYYGSIQLVKLLSIVRYNGTHSASKVDGNLLEFPMQPGEEIILESEVIGCCRW